MSQQILLLKLLLFHKFGGSCLFFVLFLLYALDLLHQNLLFRIFFLFLLLHQGTEFLAFLVRLTLNFIKLLEFIFLLFIVCLNLL